MGRRHDRAGHQHSPFADVSAVTIGIVGVVLGCAIGCSAESQPDPSPIFAIDSTHTEHFIPLPDLPQGRFVNAADLAIGPNRALHCVVSISYGPRGSTRGWNLYYLRAERRTTGWSWAPAQLLSHDATKNPRVLIAGDRLHILAGLFLDHFISDDDGRTWRNDGTMVSADSASARIVDVASVGDTVIVAYTSWLRSTSGPFRVDDSRTRLHAARWLPSGELRDDVLAEYPVPARATPGARLAVNDRTVHLFAGISDLAKEWSSSTGVPLPSRGSLMQYHGFRSEDAGRTWTHPSRIPLPEEVDLGKHGAVGEVGWLPDIALAASPVAVWAFWGQSGLHGHRMLRKDHWENPQRLADHPIQEPDPGLGRASIQAVAVRSGTIAAWISLAHARPETGPDWSPNSDIYLTALSRSDPNPRHVRITGATTYPRAIRMRARGDSLYILRNGFDTTSPNGYDPNRRVSFYCIPIERVFPTKPPVR